MKKSLLFTAALLAVSSMQAELSWKAETVWAYNQVGTVCTTVPGIEGGWGALQNNPATVSSTCSRFATGKDGKILTTDHIKNAIIAIGPNNEITTFKELPARTAEKWNGTAVSTDDAGNVIINYCFIDAKKSLTQWGVIAKDGTLTNIDLSTDISTLGKTGRVDCLGKVVGDVNSAEGGIGYITMQNSGDVVMLHFKGDGTKVTSLTAKKCTLTLGGLLADEGNSCLSYAAPSYFTVGEILAQQHPENCFYTPFGTQDWRVNASSPEYLTKISVGMIANFTTEGQYSPLTGIGNRMCKGIASFQFEGKTYLVRNYISDEFLAKHSAYTPSLGVLNYGVFDLDGKCVAAWQESEFGNGNGMSSISVQKIDDKSFYVYTYFPTTTANAETNTAAGVYCATTKLTITEVQGSDLLEGSGTAANPYLIQSVEDFCNAHKLINQNEPTDMVYFKQTADLDMKDLNMDKYEALNGWGGAYYGKFSYDGDYHVIRNFTPEVKEPVDNVGGYYSSTLFGVAAGEIKNLGVIDCNIVNGKLGVGALAGYAGHGNSTDLKIDNVFVTGKISGDNVYTGGFVGTTAKDLTISNSYAVVDVAGTYTGGIVGRLRNTLTLSNGYVKATITSNGQEDKSGLIAGSDKTPAVNVNKFFAVGSGKTVGTGVTGNATAALPEYTEQVAGVIRTLDAFNEGKTLAVGGVDYATLNWMTEDQISGVEDVIVDNIEDSNAPVEYFNLQGVRVENPSTGLYIKRQGNKVTKVIIR